MATTREDIKEWFLRGKSQGATHMLVVCDQFDYEDYPVFIQKDENVREKEKEYDAKEMQRVMEVYNLSKDMDQQLSQARCFTY